MPFSLRFSLIAASVLLISGCATQGLHKEQQASVSVGEHDNANSQSPDAQQSTAQQSTTPIRLRNALHRVYNRWSGTPYRYGGTTQSGVDCSSFVRQAVDTAASYKLPRTTRGQVKTGSLIPRSDLETGDLVFFKTGRHSRHVGVYLKDGRFMHASSSQGVTISRLGNAYWRRHYWQSRRLHNKELGNTNANKF
ncbi:hypothetical protein HKX42_02735 [Salinisphaera sp. USBA-960]|uniref:C40 family peptidase n=1 Tax=Salinisphaera orenii TaxID=856731 RepID=UPI000DBE1AB2|nr:hypothetical protein [Salifodinibacter halophilus]NNC25792.1 hypothetical protein [Salifodinibacter halophilus]